MVDAVLSKDGEGMKDHELNDKDEDKDHLLGGKKEEKDHILNDGGDSCIGRKSIETREVHTTSKSELAFDDQTLNNKEKTVSTSSLEEKESDGENTEHNNYHHHKYRWYHVNMSIMPAKWCYFFECARKSAVNANMILFLTQIGLAKGEAGLILGFRWVFFKLLYLLL